MIISFKTYSFIVSETNLNDNLYKKYTESKLKTNFKTQKVYFNEV